MCARAEPEPAMATGERRRMLEILRHNTGFDDPESWVAYATQHGFKRVRSIPIECCPDCGGVPARQIGQYIYYSTLMRLRECSECGLVWADAKLDSAIVAEHFDHVYKDEKYFEQSRRLTFSEMAKLIDQHAVRGARILDIGGAKGHLMSQVKERRPDLRITVNDIAEEKLRWAAQQFGFETIHGDARALGEHRCEYDVVVISDVLYYIQDIAIFWEALTKLLVRGGLDLIRIPNKLWLIVLAQAVTDLWRLARRDRRTQDRIKYFNPEHAYVFSRGYIEKRLRGLGFRDIRMLPVPPLSSVAADILLAGVFRLTVAINRISGGRVVASPSAVVIARYLPASFSTA